MTEVLENVRRLIRNGRNTEAMLECLMDGRTIEDDDFEEHRQKLDNVLCDAIQKGLITSKEEFNKSLIKFNLGSAEEFIARNNFNGLFAS